MKIPVKLIKEEVIAIYGKEMANTFLTCDSKMKEVNDAIKECGTIIEFVPGPTKDQYELALPTYPQVFKKMPKEFQTVQNSCMAVRGDIINLEHCSLIDPEIIAAALTIPKLKTYHLKAITEYAARADYEPLLNEVCFPKYIKAFPKQYQPLCTKFGRGRLTPLLKPADIAELVENDPTNVVNLEIAIDDPIWRIVAKKNPRYVFDLYRAGQIGSIPYDILIIALMECNDLISACDFNDPDHFSAIISTIFAAPDAIRYVPTKDINDALIMTAITVNPPTIVHIPSSKMSSSMMRYVLERDPNLIRHLYKNDIPVDLIVRAIELNFDNINYLKAEDIDPVLRVICPGITDDVIAWIETSVELGEEATSIQDMVYNRFVESKTVAKWEKSIEISNYRPYDDVGSVIGTTETEVVQEPVEVIPEPPKGDLEIIPVD